jgi:hypothetical protein
VSSFLISLSLSTFALEWVLQLQEEEEEEEEEK